MPSLTRRQALHTLGLGAAGVLLGQKALGQGAAAQPPAVQPAPPPAGPFRLAPLPYPNDALAPHIDARTMEIHHDRHHQAYVNNLNVAVAGNAALSAMTIDQIVRGLADVPMPIRAAVTNNGGGHWNHTFFWSVMAPTGKGGELKGDLLKAIEESFKSVDEFKKAFAAAATTRFGSGWAWLVPSKDKPLAVVSSPNQDNPLMAEGGPKPILGLDVWEHAYYLKYRNARPKYIEEWWKVVNWDAVAANYAAVGKK